MPLPKSKLHLWKVCKLLKNGLTSNEEWYRMSLILFTALGFSRGWKILFYWPASTSLLRLMNIFTARPAMLVPFPPLVSLLPDDEKLEANSDTYFQGWWWTLPNVGSHKFILLLIDTVLTFINPFIRNSFGVSFYVLLAVHSHVSNACCNNSSFNLISSGHKAVMLLSLHVWCSPEF